MLVLEILVGFRHVDLVGDIPMVCQILSQQFQAAVEIVRLK